MFWGCDNDFTVPPLWGYYYVAPNGAIAMSPLWGLVMVDV
jgi:hypothetical protein